VAGFGHTRRGTLIYLGVHCVTGELGPTCAEGSPCYRLSRLVPHPFWSFTHAVTSCVVILGAPHFEAHSGKKATYKNQKVTPTKTNRLATIIVSLVRDQARFGFCQGNTLLTFRRRHRIPAVVKVPAWPTFPIAPLLTLLAYLRGRSKKTPANSILACTGMYRRCSRASLKSLWRLYRHSMMAYESFGKSRGFGRKSTKTA
jgi:hypothetical protein